MTPLPLFGALALLPLLPQLAATDAEAPPRLVLQITVDQLRGDLPARVRERLEPGGFRYFFEQGLWFADAHYEHANTETIVGHTTLATGAQPAMHGMVGNVWLDRETGVMTYNIEDERYPLLTAGADVDRTTEVDPTQRAATTEGRSPERIDVSTIGDELMIHSAGRAKVFGVSVKDRGAVSMAGHTGKAFWFSKAKGEFVTSSYYYDSYPEWVVEWNAAQRPVRYGGTAWELSREQSSYQFGDADDSPWETDFPGYGRTFPHPFGEADGKYFTTLLTLSPVGDELTEEFAESLLVQEGLGQDEITDYLSVSFSSTDYVGHIFGPSSLEMEENLLRLDRTLARLLAFVDEQVGLERTLVVLSADHGGPEVPGYLTELGIRADYVHPDRWNREPGIAALVERFGVGQDLIARFFQPYLYLDREVMAERGLDPAEVAAAVATEVRRLDGVREALSSHDLLAGRVADTPLTRSILNSFHPKRSGDVIVVFEPHRFINDFDGLSVAATHGSPWSYDTFVPIAFAGAGVPAGMVHRRVAPTGIAPTIAAFLGFKAPSGALGEPFLELLGE
jgi:predicted AlkP superfamily pyrophosphatase or phosphodiesterase